MKILLVTGETSAIRIARTLRKTDEVIACVVGLGLANNAALARNFEGARLPSWQMESLQSESLPTDIVDAKIDLLISFRCPKIIPGNVLKAPRIGAFNLHTGPLPEYAGLNVPSWAIFNGETSHACTLHWMAPGIDTGDIVSSRRIPIGIDETGISLTGKCVAEGVNLVKELVELSRAGGHIQSEPQDLSKRNYYSNSVPNSGVIDWSWSALQIERVIRASNFQPFPSPWGTPKANVNGREFGILAARAVGGIAKSIGTVVARGLGYKDIGTGYGIIRILDVMLNGNPCSVDELDI